MNQFNLLNILNTLIDTTLNSQSAVLSRTSTSDTQTTTTTTNNTLLSSSSKTSDSQKLQQVMQENSSVIKEALQLPQDLKDLMGQIAKTTNNNQAQNSQNQQSQGWSVDSEVDLNMLTKLLGENSKETMQKLVQVLAKDGNVNAKSIKSALSGMVDVGGVGENSSNQVIKNVLLLYLPYLPFDPEKKNFNFDISFTSGGEEDIADQGIELLIKTENYGNIKAYLSLGDEKTVNIIVGCNKAFPTDLLSKLMQKEGNKNKIKVVLHFSDKNQPTQNPLGSPKTESGQKEVKIKSSSSTIKSGLILMSYSLIKSVFEIDKG